MANIDDRVVSASFDNKKFEANVAQTLATLKKLDEALKHIGTTNGLANLEKAANKVNLAPLAAGLDNLKKKLDTVGTGKGFSDIEGAANKVSFGPLGTAIEGIKGKLSNFTDAPAAALDKLKEKLGFKGAEQGFSNIESAASKVKLAGASSAVENLKDKLTFKGVEQSFANIERASGKVHLEGISNAITNVSKSFSILQGAAAVALGSLVSKAAVAGGSMVKSLSVGPLLGGLKEYETNLNSIQTILANTEFQGSTLKDVNKALLQLNKYSDQTIYNFSQMAKNIGTFTAAGVDLDTSVASIKGIANLAALSGSSAEQASTAMYQLSQAIASGRVSLQDWNSVVNAGMGGATFQRALANTASAMGTIAEGALKVDKATGKATINGQSFRESITAKPGEESWLTSDVLTSTLQQFTGDLSKAELAAMGFNEEQIQAIQKTAKTAKLAATEVKTLSGVFDVAKESIGSGWSSTFQLIFGDFVEAKSLFTGVSQALTGFIGASADARNKTLGDWKELGGRKVLISGITNAFQALFSVIRPIKEAFREIFPKKTGKDLFELTKRFADFAEQLKIGPKTAEDLRRTFAGFFAILDIGKKVIFGILGVFGDLLGAAKNGSGGFLNFTGSIGDFLVSIDKTLEKGQYLTKFFDGLGNVLEVPIKLLGDLADVLVSVFSSDTSGGVSSSLDDLTNSLSPMAQALKLVQTAWRGFLSILGTVKEALGPVIGEIVDLFGNVGETIANAIGNSDFEQVFDIIQTTLIAGILVAVKKGFGNGFNIDVGGGALKNLSGSLEVLTGSLKTMQRNVQAGTLLKISSAIGVLAVGVKLLSTIDPKRLASAMTAVAVGLGELVGAMALLTKGTGFTGFLRMPFIAGSLILLAGAIDVLAIAIVIFSKMDWDELGKGLAGVGGALVAIGLGTRAIPPSVALIGPALLPLAVALNIMALAVKIFATLNWEEMAKGLLGVAGSLTAVGLGVKLIGPSILLVGPGLIGVAIALGLLAGAVKAFGSMDLKTIGKGLLGIAGSLTVIGLAISLIPPTIALQAAGLILVGIALNEIALAIGILGQMKIGTIVKGIGAIGTALLVLAVGLTLMAATLPGSVALLAAASALAILTPVIGILGNMKWSTIFKGLAAIGLALGALAVAGIIAGPGLALLGLALIPLAAALGIIGGSIYLVSTGLSKLGKDGAKNIAAISAAMIALVAIVPKVIVNFVKGLVEIVAAIAKLAPDIVDSMVKIVESLLDVVIKAAPKMAVAVGALITAFLKVINDNAGNIITSGFNLLVNFLSGIADNIGKVTEQVFDIVVNFLTALTNSLPKIIAAGANTLVKFLFGLASNFPKVVAAGAEALVQFLSGVASNIPKIVAAAANLIVQFVEGISSNIGKVIKAGANLIVKVLEGIGDEIGKVAKAATNMVKEFIEAAVKAALDLVDTGATAVINFINGVASAIRTHAPELGRAGGNLGEAIIQGAITGMASMAGALVSKALSLFGDLPGAVKKFLGIKSPSRVFAEIGKNIMLGTMTGIDANSNQPISAIQNSAEDMIRTMERSLRVVPDLLEGLMDMDPVITPVLDLSSVEKEAQRLAQLTNIVPITAAVSYRKATDISASQKQIETTSDDSIESIGPSSIKFEQNNYSPEALSAIEIYRQTRNQIAQAKKALGL